MSCFKFCIFIFLFAVPCLSAGAQEVVKAVPFGSNSCLAATDGARNWPKYCDEAQVIHDRLVGRTRTAPVELKQLKALLWENDDQQMWQFLAISLAERSPYFSSTPRRLALMDEIEESLGDNGRIDGFVKLAANAIRAKEQGEAGKAAGYIEEGVTMLSGENNRHLLALLGSTMIKLAQLNVDAGDYAVALDALALCRKASDAWGNPLMPQRCYNLMQLSGSEPEVFLAEIATTEKMLTCGRGLKPLCNLFMKAGHGKYLPN
ncbi:hypothetical protein [Kordiimonas sp.]|uniref:hypothetical protein n=1 Tax=Kordiimonas sp. TaxID=1970157 RepID=UPI003A90E0A2